jgi:methionyl-tRNA formyltransferase
MDKHIDTGPMLWRGACAITPEDDAISLGERLADLGATGLIEVLRTLPHGRPVPEPQPSLGASYAPKLSRDLSHLDWQQSAIVLHNRIRGLLPWPGALAQLQTIEVKFWRTAVSTVAAHAAPGTITAITPEGLHIACGSQHLLVSELQPANRRRMPAREFVQGYRVQQGQRFD